MEKLECFSATNYHFKNDIEGAVKTDRRNRSGSSKAIEMALAYSEQQR